ncbi:MAG TPA: tetratricopeptide repeat protein [Patescibacteria group bacterium]|nr:tetratricopeptide repeat protein [Patescibacteria group bacterium]
MTPLKTKISLILFGFLVFVLLLEAALRLAGFTLLSIQEHRNLQSLKHKGSYRIVCLGESTTVGQYPSLLEEILNRRNIGMRFSVIDKGVVGTTTDAIMSRLLPNLAAYTPDMVIAMMGVNDRQLMCYKGISAVYTRLFLRSRVFRLMFFVYERVSEKIKEVAESGRGFNYGQLELSGLQQSPLPYDADPQPQDVDTCLRLAQAFLSRGNFSRAEGAFRKAIELESQSGRAHRQFERFRQNYPRIEDTLKKAITAHPQEEAAYIELEWLYGKPAGLARAEDTFKKLIALNPRNEHAYIMLGSLYGKAHQLSGAQELLEKAVALAPQNERAYVPLGRNYRTQGKFALAEEAFQKAIALKPQNERAYTELGWSYQAQGKFSQAEEAFQKAVALNPQDERPYEALSKVYENINKPELGRAYAEKAANLRARRFEAGTIQNYRRLKDILSKKGIRLVCVQYPLRPVGALQEIFQGRAEGIVFVDNERIFKDAVEKDGYDVYFDDTFAGDFGHCTAKGNRLLAENIADTIVRRVFTPDHASHAAF